MQSERQKQTIAQIELGRTERIEGILEEWLKRGHNVLQVYIDGAELPYRSLCADLQGKGDSRREADAQLASKLQYQAPISE